MITLAIREALLDDSVMIPGFVYVVRDNDISLYIGHSLNPMLRLAQHLGIADRSTYYTLPEHFIAAMEQGKECAGLLSCSAIGECIRLNAPESLMWTFDIYELEDAMAALKRDNDTIKLPAQWASHRDRVESALIRELHPCLNKMLNWNGRPLPAHYRKYELQLGSSDNLF